MGYKVTGALAVCETPDGKKIYRYKDAPVPDDTVNLASLIDDELVGPDDGDVAPSWQDDPDGPGGAPAKSATKDEWVTYAVSQGAAQADAEAATKDQLIAQYGS